MIGSILRALRGDAGLGISSSEAALPAFGDTTRSGFLKLMAGTAIAAGLGSAAFARKPISKPKVPPITDIDKLYDAWQDRMNAGDLEGLVDLYLDDVTYVNPDGKLLHGKAAVREDFISLLALKPQIVLGDRQHLLWRDVALTTNHWRMTFTGPDGKEQVATGGGIEVMQKQADGGWRYIIDDASRSASK